MTTHRPPLTDDANLDYWTSETTNQLNETASRVDTLEAVIINGELILTSPNGTRFKLTVANDGTLSATAL